MSFFTLFYPPAFCQWMLSRYFRPGTRRLVFKCHFVFESEKRKAWNKLSQLCFALVSSLFPCRWKETRLNFQNIFSFFFFFFLEPETWPFSWEMWLSAHQIKVTFNHPSPDTSAALHEQRTIMKSQPVINRVDPDLSSKCGALEALLTVIIGRASPRKSGKDDSWGILITD